MDKLAIRTFRHVSFTPNKCAEQLTMEEAIQWREKGVREENRKGEKLKEMREDGKKEHKNWSREGGWRLYGICKMQEKKRVIL